MRIGQLARKLEISPSQIIDYLEELGIEADKGVNTKLGEAGVDSVMKKFGKMPESVESEEVSDVPAEESIDTEEEPVEVMEEESEPEIEPVQEEEPEIETGQKEEKEEGKEEEEIEVIRPEKIKLQGLKVMGKIDLPEPKPKEEPKKEPAEETEKEIKAEEAKEEVDSKPKEDDSIITEAQIRADIRKHRQQKKRQPRKIVHRKKRQLTYEEKLEKEKRLAEKKKVDLEKQKKAQKRKSYEEKMKTVQPVQPKKAKKKKAEVEVQQNTVKPKTEQPKTVWGKFMRWLNT